MELSKVPKKSIIVPPLPFEMNNEVWGDVLRWERPAPGVFDIYTTLESFYAVVKEHNKSISQKALQCAEKCDNGVYYFAQEEQQIIVEYELLKMRLKDATPDLVGSIQESMSALDDLGKEICPEYFGIWPTPAETPWGHVDKCVEMAPGIWLLRVGQQRVLSVVKPFCSDLHDPLKELGSDLSGVSDGPVFWKTDAAPIIYELMTMNGFSELRQSIRSEEELETYLCDFCPKYVSFYNGLLDIKIKQDKEGRGLFAGFFESEKIKKTCPTVSEYLNADIIQVMEG